MSNVVSNVPILFLIFNRLDTTEKVFGAIRQARPPRLYVAADGPRCGREGEAERCAQVRRITEEIDWPCEVYRLYRDENLGCKKAISSAITWFFENEEEGIILEDDCLPDPSFFPYCGAMLEKYRNDERIMMVAGSDHSRCKRTGGPSYYFTTYFSIWGWATWRRAWQHYDITMSAWPEFKRRRGMRSAVKNRAMARWSESCLDLAYRGEIDTWDYQWIFAGLLNGRLSICPSSNLISNIGYEGTHGGRGKSDQTFLGLSRERFDVDAIVHPDKIAVDRETDRAIYQAVMKVVYPWGPLSVADRFVWKVWLKVRGEV